MKAKEIRKIARENLSGKWLKGAAITLIFAILIYFVAFALTMFAASILAPIAFILYIAVLPPIAFSIMPQFLRLQKGEDVGVLDFAEWTTSNFKNSWKVTWHIFTKIWPLILAVVLCVIFAVVSMAIGTVGLLESISSDSSAVILLCMAIASISMIAYVVFFILLMMKMFYYYLIPFIMQDEPELSAKEVVEKSAKLMQNNRWRLFCLSLSFLGWAILSAFTLGIGLLFLIPYMQMSFVAFYQECAGKLDTTDKTDVAE